MEWNALWDLLVQAGPAGAAVGLAVLVFVYLGSLTDVFKGGVLKRAAVVLSGVLFAGVEPGDVEAAFVAAIGIAGATLAKLLIDLIVKAVREREK